MAVRVGPVGGQRVLAIAFAALAAIPGSVRAQASPQPSTDPLAPLCRAFLPDPPESGAPLACPLATVPSDGSLFGGLLPGTPILLGTDALDDQQVVGDDLTMPSLDPRSDLVGMAATEVSPSDDHTFESALEALPGAVGTPRTDSDGSLALDFRFDVTGEPLPDIYLVNSPRSTVPADPSTIDPTNPPVGVTVIKLAGSDPATGQVQPGPGVIAAPTGDGVTVAIDALTADMVNAQLAILARQQPDPTLPDFRVDSFFLPVPSMPDPFVADVLSSIERSTVRNLSQHMFLDFLATCRSQTTKVSVQPDGKPPAAGHPTPAVAETCGMTTGPPTGIDPGSGATSPSSGACEAQQPTLSEDFFVFCGGKPIPTDADRTLIMVVFDQPFDPLNGSNGVYGSPLLDINPTGKPGSGFKARSGFPFDSLQGSKSYLKVVSGLKGQFGQLNLRSIAPGKYAPKTTAGFAVYGPSFVIWELPASPMAVYLPLTELTTLTGRTSFETVVTGGSLDGVPLRSGPARLLPMFFTPHVVPVEDATNP